MPNVGHVHGLSVPLDHRLFPAIAHAPHSSYPHLGPHPTLTHKRSQRAVADIAAASEDDLLQELLTLALQGNDRGSRCCIMLPSVGSSTNPFLLILKTQNIYLNVDVHTRLVLRKRADDDEEEDEEKDSNHDGHTEEDDYNDDHDNNDNEGRHDDEEEETNEDHNGNDSSHQDENHGRGTDELVLDHGEEAEHDRQEQENRERYEREEREKKEKEDAEREAIEREREQGAEEKQHDVGQEQTGTISFFK